jgi:type II secretory pathway component PulJ
LIAWKRRNGQSLLEVIAAGIVIAVALVPALRMMRDSLKVSRDIESANLLVLLCSSKLEEQIIRVAARWERGTTSGDFASEGRGDLRFVVVRSDDSDQGGIPSALMAVTSTVWQDRNGNGAIDANEPKVSLATKVGRMESYQNAAK